MHLIKKSNKIGKAILLNTAGVNIIVVMGAGGGGRKLRYFDILGQKINHFSQNSPYLTTNRPK